MINVAVKPDERKIDLEGAANFRDLGGYENAHGQTVEMKKIFRSDSLANLTNNDLNRLKQIGIGRIYDLRSYSEVKRYPDVVPEGGIVEYTHLPVDSSAIDTVTAMKRLKQKDISWLSPTFMIDSYRRNLENFPETWGKIINETALPEAPPLVFHCTAGKDRTGVCAALILLVLGVPEETIIYDHSLSNIFLKNTISKINQYIQSLGVDPEKLTPYLTAPHEAITFALDHIKKKYGSADAYLVKKAGVSEKTLDTLRGSNLYS